MRIREFCKQLGIHRSTVLRLEAKRLLQSKRDWAGHRRFTEEDVKHAQKLLFREAGERKEQNEITQQ
jgi:excisionase family DNA binding protein